MSNNDIGDQAITIAKITDNRVKEITMSELRSVFALSTDEEIKLIAQAIKSGNAGRIQASIEMPVYRVMQEKVIAEGGVEKLPYMLKKQAD